MIRFITKIDMVRIVVIFMSRFENDRNFDWNVVGVCCLVSFSAICLKVVLVLVLMMMVWFDFWCTIVFMNVVVGMFSSFELVGAVLVDFVVGVLSLVWLFGLVLWFLVGVLFGVVWFGLGVLLFDVLVYWIYCFSYEVLFLWCFYVVYYFIERLDWVSGLCIYLFDGVFVVLLFVLLLVVGFFFCFMGALVAVQLVVDLFLYVNVWWWLCLL